MIDARAAATTVSLCALRVLRGDLKRIASRRTRRARRKAEIGAAKFHFAVSREGKVAARTVPSVRRPRRLARPIPQGPRRCWSFAHPTIRFVLSFLLGLILLPSSFAQHIEYARPVDAAPTPEAIGNGYTLPVVQQPLPRPDWKEIVDLSVLAAALGLGAWVVLKRRSRREVVLLTIICLLYFGFYRKGCICAIGAIQNVTVALTDQHYAVSYFAIGFFLLPLLAALLFGRVYCGGVCPLGAIQELVTLRPVRVPRKLDKALGSIKWIYLGLAIWLAAGPAETRDFIICRYDPFVGFFRLTGPLSIMLLGVGLLVLGLFVGRPYCRYLCPYGALLSMCSRASWKNVSITPDKELDCGLCSEGCPYGAIKDMRAEKGSCLYCARCFNTCPRHRVMGRDEISAPTDANSVDPQNLAAARPEERPNA